MRIGVDLDDTICRTTEKVHEKVEIFSKKLNLNPLDVMNDELLSEQFFKENLEEIYKTVEIKREVKKVLKRLKSKGNEIYIITARKADIVSNVKEITKKWLKDNEIEVDKIIVEAYGEKKAIICKENHIDLMIEDDPYNFRKIQAKRIPCILFDDRERYDLRHDYMTNWLDIEKYIERNR